MRTVGSRLRAGPLDRRLRAFAKRLTTEQMDNYRQEGQQGHIVVSAPWLMPDFWQFPTVSMGLGPLMAIYRARYDLRTAAWRKPKAARSGRSWRR
jgi:pyruvate dehydrogenase complex dehydrogenase (E1) component